MKDKDIYAVIGWLILNDIHEIYTPEVCAKIYEYLETINLSYDFVIKVLNDDVGPIYHKAWWREGETSSDYDYIDVVEETGEIGIWCEVDGFVAYLDKYKQEWWVNLRRHRKNERRHTKLMKGLRKRIRKSAEKAFKDTQGFEIGGCKYNKETNSLEVEGLGDYSLPENKGETDNEI